MASICNGGGGSTAIILENLSWLLTTKIRKIIYVFMFLISSRELMITYWEANQIDFHHLYSLVHWILPSSPVPRESLPIQLYSIFAFLWS